MKLTSPAGVEQLALLVHQLLQPFLWQIIQLRLYGKRLLGNWLLIRTQLYNYSILLQLQYNYNTPSQNVLALFTSSLANIMTNYNQPTQAVLHKYFTIGPKVKDDSDHDRASTNLVSGVVVLAQIRVSESLLHRASLHRVKC